MGPELNIPKPLVGLDIICPQCKTVLEGEAKVMRWLITFASIFHGAGTIVSNFNMITIF